MNRKCAVPNVLPPFWRAKQAVRRFQSKLGGRLRCLLYLRNIIFIQFESVNCQHKLLSMLKHCLCKGRETASREHGLLWSYQRGRKLWTPKIAVYALLASPNLCPNRACARHPCAPYSNRQARTFDFGLIPF